MSRVFGRRGAGTVAAGRTPDDRVVNLAVPNPAGRLKTRPDPSRVTVSRKSGSGILEDARARLRQQVTAATLRTASRGDLAKLADGVVTQVAADRNKTLEAHEHRDLITVLINDILNSDDPLPEGGEDGAATDPKTPDAARTKAGTKPQASRGRSGNGNGSTSHASVLNAKQKVQVSLLDRIDVGAASELPRGELAQQIGDVVQEILAEQKIQLNLAEQRDLVTMLLNDMLGLGPLEPLLHDESITDIMVNGPKQVYVERGGKLTLTDIAFRDNSHVMNIATRIVTRIGRRVDESSPLVDARLEDGSRVNIIVPPLAIDGPSISIRKFSKKKITLEVYEKQRNMSPEMATVLRIGARARLNILISGGTGSGKTTLLNALSQMIDPGERIVTIEDAAELQLQQPHVIRLETRPANLEGTGEITMRDLVKNALRMRPDRIILGEVRGSEALDMLQAMNTGHEGSMGTIHANSPRESLTRLENMIAMAGINLSPKAVRTQVSDALDMIVQVARMRDGIRRIVSLTEIVGMEGDIVTTQELFAFKYEGEDSNGHLIGRFESSGLRPYFAPKADYFGLGKALMEAI